MTAFRNGYKVRLVLGEAGERAVDSRFVYRADALPELRAGAEVEIDVEEAPVPPILGPVAPLRYRAVLTDVRPEDDCPIHATAIRRIYRPVRAAA